MPLAAPVSPPPLLEGDTLTSDEFLCRWEEIADLKRAELIEGIVYMPSPVSLGHGRFESFLNIWLGFYATGTPGCLPSLEATWLMVGRNVPQPDVTLTILPEYGGQSGIKGPFHAGAPELIVEVAVSSYSRDFGAKRRLYESMGVREYLIALPGEEKLVWHVLTPAGFQTLEPGTDGVYRSSCFPGLWLAPDALWALDLARMNNVLQQGLATPEHATFAAELASKKR
jgi:Uma2 family endonuclease